VKLDLNSLLYHMVHVSRCLVQDGDVAKVNVMSCIEFVLCHGRFFWLAQTYVSDMFLTSGLN
jgi:hypothetical protein